MSEAVASDAAILRELRRVRRERRLGDTEWFDVLYRVYLFALVGTGVVLYLSDTIAGLLDEPIPAEDILSRGPSIAGIVAALAFGIGLQNGSDGGPVSVESADVRHLLLSPISRTRVLLRPIVQRFRSIAFALGLSLAIVGQLVARELAGSRAAWAASGALFGVLLAALYVGSAVVAHALRMPRWLATTIATVAVVWQSVVAWRIWFDEATGLGRIGPFNLDGSILFWGIRERWIDVIALAIAATLLAAALALGGRLRLQPLERRGQLVSQLRFAATVQDIRTVVLLRRQLRAESIRARPWLGRNHHPAPTTIVASPTRPGRTTDSLRIPGFVWRRGAAAFNRLPLSRIVRMAGLAAVAGVSGSLTVTASWLFLVPLVGSVYLLGLESLEPLAQEVDHPDLTDGFPVERGWLFAHHLVAPAIVLAAAGLVGAAAAAVVDPTHAAAAFALGIPLAWAGAIGAVVTTVGDAPDPVEIQMTTLTGADRGAESPLAMPEFAGFKNVGKGAIPVVLSAIAAGPIAALRLQPDAAMVGRSVVGVALCLAVMIWWVIRRDRLSVAIRNFFAAGRTASAPGGNA
ncbi:hypothetical protein [Ilumatobacter nonamiensis]|uniref:hypothetical protein n=1 Tax=Ilumatobacter nonamiensis TaxID=467093 RepID=UPI000348FBA4|nr:hypothetical protein [Ilumatobacter nonamiensis]